MTRDPFHFGPGTREIELGKRPLAQVVTSFSGAIPCRVIGAAIVTSRGPHVWAPAEPGQIVLAVEYTAARRGYEKGDRAAWPIWRVVPRAAFSQGKYGVRIRAYDWALICPALKSN